MPIYDVFISYRRSDGAELAAVVANALRAKGLSVFFDTEEIKSGEDFTLRIENALRQAPNYLLIATPDVFKFRTNEKDWVLEEMKIACENYAHNLDKNRMFTLVVPRYVYRDVNRNDPSKGKRQVPVALPKAETWPAEVFDLSKPNRIQLKSNLPDEKELREILESVTRVTHHNMWNAGHRWLQENRQPGRRFASLDISKTIFPHALSMDVQEDEEDEEFPSMVQAQQNPSAKPEGEKLPLFDALTKTENHIYLVGEGGIGKTTSLIHIMERAYQNRAYSEEAQVPLFVELSKAPDTAGRLYANGKSTFIYRAIYRLVRQDRTVKQVTGAEVEETEEAFIADPQTAVTPVKALLSNWNKPPQYLLLLDGLNEVSRTEIVIQPTDEEGRATSEAPTRRTVYEMIVEEINNIMETCPNVQIVLTGRADDGAVQGKNITRWQLTGIDDESIRTYLGGKVPENEKEAIMGNRVLLDTLRIPLFLTMYIRLKEKAGITTQGEILHTFFSEKGKLLGDYDLPYSMRNRLGQVEEELNRSAKGKPDLRLTASMQFFMIDFLLAALGRYMEKNNLFSVTSHQVEEVIRPILEDTAPTSVCGRFGEQAFPKYKKKGSLSSTVSVAEQLKALIGTGNGAARQFCLLASSVLGILVDDGKYNYSFIHQHVRDYFAALHVMNALWIGVVCSWTNREAAYAFLNSELSEKPLGFTVRQMLGEAAGEHHNKPWQDEEGNWHYNVPDKTKPHNRNLIPLAMDVYRDRFDEQNSYALWNLIQVLKEVRQDLCGEDFSRLDLTMIRLNRHHPGKRGCAANFSGAKLQRELFMPMGHADTVNSVAFSPDGKRIVTASIDGTARIWNTETFREMGMLKGSGRGIISAVYRPDDGRHILTASYDGSLTIWDAETLQEINSAKECVEWMPSLNSAAYSPDGKYIVIATLFGRAKILDAESLQMQKQIDVHTDKLTSMNSAVYSHDGKLIFAAMDDSTVRVLDAETLKELGHVTGRGYGVESNACSPDSKQIITMTNDGNLKVWDTQTYQEIVTLEMKTAVCSVSYSPDGKHIVASTFKKNAILWDAKTYQKIGTLNEHNSWMESVAYSPDGKQIATASQDCTTKVWNARTLQELGTLEGHNDKLKAVAYSPDGKRLITAMGDFTVKIWDTSVFRLRGTLAGHKDSLTGVSYSPDGKLIVSMSFDNTIKLWNAETFQELGTLKGDTRWPDSIFFNCDGKKFTTITSNGDTETWDINTFQRIGTHKKIGYRYKSAAYSPDRRQLVMADKKTVKVWEVQPFHELGSLGRYMEKFNMSVYSPDGKKIITVTDDHNVIIWDSQTYQEIGTVKGHGIINSVSFNSDGKRLITSSTDRKARIWDAETFQQLGILEGHEASVEMAMFCSDNRHIFTASRDGTVKIWDAETFECIRTIRNVAKLEVMGCDFRNLHPDASLSDEDRQLLWDYGADV